MVICPHCQVRGGELYEACPSGDGYFLIDEEEAQGYLGDPWLGRRLGERFIITSILGQGSMGHVYKAYQQQVDRTVAIKLFDTIRVHSMLGEEKNSGGPGAKERFIQEAKVLAKLSHPNCVTLYDFGLDGDGRFLYIAMEHVGGISLRRALRRGVKMEAIIEIVRQILMALREAHALNIVHRDLKPENIILSYRRTSDEQIVKVLDFGIAKLLQSESMERTATGLLFGTPAYMSPEQCRGEAEVTAATDIYALGCIIFEMVTGRLPYISERPQEMVRLHQHAPIPAMVPRGKMELPQGLEAYVQRCMAKEPGKRFANAAAALAAFERIVGDEVPGGLKMRGLGKLADELVIRKVTVPENRLSGAPLDPTGERERLKLEELQKEVPQKVEVRPQSAGDSYQVKETMRGSSEAAAKRERRVVSGGHRRGLVITALLVVVIFCILVFAAIYVSLPG